ncbi:MAG: SWIM zinc finger family protein [Segetibacter sp.]
MEIKEVFSDYLDDIYSTVKKKGERLFKKNGIVLKVFTTDTAVLTVPSESSTMEYTVTFNFEDEFADAECECFAFEEYGECKHCVAAALYLQSHALPAEETESSGENKTVAETDGEVIIPFKSISFYEVNKLTRKHYSWDNYTNERKTNLKKVDGANHFFVFTESAKKSFELQITFLQPSKLKLSCTCGKAKKNDICLHLFSALGILRNKFGDYYFNRFKDYTKEKNELISPYGLTLEDAEAKDFEFGFDNYGTLILKNAPSYLVKINDEKSLSALAHRLIQPVHTQSLSRPLLPAGEFIDFDLGYLFNFSAKQHIHFSLQPLAISNKNNKTAFEKITFVKERKPCLFKVVAQ